MPGIQSEIEFSLVIPTYNERDNIEPLLTSLIRELNPWRFEILVVDDDSPDHTWEVVERFSATHPEVRLVRRRTAPRDLAQSVMEGFSIARGAILGSMDADGSHEPAAVPVMLRTLESGYAMVVGSRHVAGGSISGWSWRRRVLSQVATWVTRGLLRLPIRDPLSGLYLIRREVYELATRSAWPRGFKILLELYVRGAPRSVVEVPIHFSNRSRGRSKLSVRVLWHGIAGVIALARQRMRAEN